MKKTLLRSLCVALCAFGFSSALSIDDVKPEIEKLGLKNEADFLANFGNVVGQLNKNSVLTDFKKLSSLDMIYVNIRSADNPTLAIPSLITPAGDTIMGIGNTFVTNESVTNEIVKIIEDTVNVEEMVSNTISDKLLRVTQQIPDAYMLEFENNATDDYVILLTDPDCPYCQTELLKELPNLILQMNVRVYFTPVHGDPSFIKSQLILDEAKDAPDNDAKYAIMLKYYSTPQLTPEQMQTDFAKLQAYRNVIFSESGIKSVPHTSYYASKKSKAKVGAN